MTIPRHLRQRSEFLTSLTRQSKKWTCKHATILLGMFAVTLIGLLHLLLPLSHHHHHNNNNPSHMMQQQQQQRQQQRQRQQQTRYKGKRLFSSPEEIPLDLIRSFDAILVLGGGKPIAIDRPPVYVERRCDDTIEVVRRRLGGNNDSGSSNSITATSSSSDAAHDGIRKEQKQQQPPLPLPILCLSAGTAHMPQLLSADGLPIWESTASAAYILSKTNADTVPPESMYVETSSYDTIGNAYFARTTHTDQNGWRKLLVVTNEFHMDRTQRIFDWIFSIPAAGAGAGTGAGAGAATTTHGYDDSSSSYYYYYDLYYLESPNVGMTPDAVAARKEREASSSNSVDRLSERFSGSLADVYRFLMREHSLYAADRLVDRGRATAADVRETAVNDAVKQSYGMS